MKNLPSAVWIACCATAFAQSQPQQPEPTRMTFDVASIKPNTSVNTNMSISRATGGQLNCTNVNLRLLLTFAYNVRDYQLAGLPGWAGADHYDILAKLSPENAASEPDPSSETAQNHLRRRTQALLTDRFGVVLHPQTRDAPIFILVVPKGGPKLTPNETAGDPQISFNNTRLMCKRVTMTQLADMALSPGMGRPVVDKTGIAGEYDLQMEFAPDTFVPNASAAGDSVKPSFPTALQERLGLRLETSRGPTQILIVDKVERPSAN